MFAGSGSTQRQQWSYMFHNLVGNFKQKNGREKMENECKNAKSEKLSICIHHVHCFVPPQVIQLSIDAYNVKRRNLRK